VKKWNNKTEGDNLVAFHYNSASEIWHNKRVVFGGSGLIRGET